ncbi:MAG: hypothetical protein E7279_05440 [Lachnospiraceae bacterium]|nr:hypothetical protein [Lachnospiraceae bacterium]
MGNSFEKVKEMISNPEMKETLVKVMNAKSPEEIMEIAKNDNIALTMEQAKTIFDGKNSNQEIDQEDLDVIKDLL